MQNDCFEANGIDKNGGYYSQSNKESVEWIESLSSRLLAGKHWKNVNNHTHEKNGNDAMRSQRERESQKKFNIQFIVFW